MLAIVFLGSAIRRSRFCSKYKLNQYWRKTGASASIQCKFLRNPKVMDFSPPPRAIGRRVEARLRAANRFGHAAAAVVTLPGIGGPCGPTSAGCIL